MLSRKVSIYDGPLVKEAHLDWNIGEHLSCSGFAVDHRSVKVKSQAFQIFSRDTVHIGVLTDYFLPVNKPA